MGNTPLSKSNRPSGMTGFTIVFIGQLISVIATQMTGFAMTLWISIK